MNHATRLLLLLIASIAPTAYSTNVTLSSDLSDFELRQDTDPFSPDHLNITTQSFSATTADVWNDGDSQYRVIEEFDLTPLLAAGDQITSATLSMTRNFSIYPGSSVQLHGFSTSRATLLSNDNPAALAAYNAPSMLLASAFAANVAPNPPTETFTVDITSFLQARYADIVANPAAPYIALRLDPQTGGTDVRFDSANTLTGLAPQLNVTVVPEPSILGISILSGLALLSRRRSAF
ncbi:MAG: DNRLRE domain-containing protein [Algisphaera sp.]